MSEQANLQLIRELYDAFGRGAIAAVLNLLDPQANLGFEGPEAIPWAGNWHGRDSWTKFFQTLGGSADEITLKMEPFAAQGDNVVTIGRYQARVKLTGKRIDSPLVHLWTIRNGLVVMCQELTNTAAEAAACTDGALSMTPKETVELIYAAFQRGEIQTILDQLAPDVFWRQPASVPWGGDSVGPAQVGAFFTKLNDIVETTGFEVEDNIEARDEIVSYGYFSSRNCPTGKTSRARFVFRWKFQNGKVIHFEAVLDSAPIMTAARA